MPLLFLRGINLPFGRLVPCAGQVPYALRTRAPVAGGLIAEAPLPLDLHVLGLSLAFILSQDQTLRCMTCFCFSFRACRVAAAGPRLIYCLPPPRPAGRGGGGAVHHVNVLRSRRLDRPPRRAAISFPKAGAKLRGLFDFARGGRQYSPWRGGGESGFALSVRTLRGLLKDNKRKKNRMASLFAFDVGLSDTSR